MEKKNREIKRIVITGPESTGKTELCGKLASSYNTLWIPEYARYYIEKLNRKYTYNDVEKIAYKQVELEQDYSVKVNKILFYDTYLIITKVWFQVVFGKFPEWLHDKLFMCNIDLFLVCDIDIPWKSDSVRENGGEMRKKLFEMYQRELNNYNFNYEIVNGIGVERLKKAKVFINEII